MPFVSSPILWNVSNKTPSWEPISLCWQSTVVIPGDVFLVVIVIFVPEEKHWNTGFSSSSTGCRHLYNTNFEQQIFYKIKWCVQQKTWFDLNSMTRLMKSINLFQNANRNQIIFIKIIEWFKDRKDWLRKCAKCDICWQRPIIFAKYNFF